MSKNFKSIIVAFCSVVCLQLSAETQNITIQNSHSDNVSFLEVNPESTLLITIDDLGIAKLWSLRQRVLLRTFLPDKGRYYIAKFGYNRLILISDENTFDLFELGSLIKTKQNIQLPFQNQPNDIFFHGNENIVIFAVTDKLISYSLSSLKIESVWKMPGMVLHMQSMHNKLILQIGESKIIIVDLNCPSTCQQTVYKGKKVERYRIFSELIYIYATDGNIVEINLKNSNNRIILNIKDTDSFLDFIIEENSKIKYLSENRLKSEIGMSKQFPIKAKRALILKEKYLIVGMDIKNIPFLLEYNHNLITQKITFGEQVRPIRGAVTIGNASIFITETGEIYQRVDGSLSMKVTSLNLKEPVVMALTDALNEKLVIGCINHIEIWKFTSAGHPQLIQSIHWLNHLKEKYPNFHKNWSIENARLRDMAISNSEIAFAIDYGPTPFNSAFPVTVMTANINTGKITHTLGYDAGKKFIFWLGDVLGVIHGSNIYLNNLSTNDFQSVECPPIQSNYIASIVGHSETSRQITVINELGHLYAINPETKSIISKKRIGTSVSWFATQNGKSYIATPQGSYTINIQVGKKIGIIDTKVSNNKLIHIAPSNGNTSVLLTEDGEVQYKGVSTLIMNNLTDLVFTPDGYWDGSANGGNAVAMVQGMEAFGVDQFALRNNRPDIILQRLGSKNTALIEHYHQQYLKRLRKAGLTEDQLSGELHAPEAKIVETKQNGKFVDLKFTLADSKYNLLNYNIYVNGVPLYATAKPVGGKSKEISEKLELTSGENRIEVSCTNEKGAESFRALSIADYSEKTQKDLYFIGFGVSKYKDSRLTLRYAHKDVQDLKSTLGKMKGKSQYKNVYSQIFTDEEVTPENIKKAKELLKNAKVDDTFVLSISGHGVHDNDKESTYYFLTHGANIKKLSETAANFELIEDLMHGISPRNKLFLMDTCESGEVEKTANTTVAMNDSTKTSKTAEDKDLGKKGLRTRSTRGVGVKELIDQKPFLADRNRYIYNDLSRRSGAVVFSSSLGSEASLEKDEFQQGLFTHSVILGLSGEADSNKDGNISVDELKTFVMKKVPEISDNKQHPTVDRDNLHVKMGFPIAK